jgi:hypothetical protein
MEGLRTGDVPHEIVASEANRQMKRLVAGAEWEGRSVKGGSRRRRRAEKATRLTACSPKNFELRVASARRKMGVCGGRGADAAVEAEAS